MQQNSNGSRNVDGAQLLSKFINAVLNFVSSLYHNSFNYVFVTCETIITCE